VKSHKRLFLLSNKLFTITSIAYIFYDNFILFETRILCFLFFCAGSQTLFENPFKFAPQTVLPRVAEDMIAVRVTKRSSGTLNLEGFGKLYKRDKSYPRTNFQAPLLKHQNSAYNLSTL